MGSCQSTHYDLYIVRVNGVEAAVHRTRYEAEMYAHLQSQKVHVSLRHIVVDRRSGIVMRGTS